ncbi:MAG TPA: AAA family ATPase [Acidimicrobiales bacterium]|jgi:cellulose biosynthesis protein BcsQ|nr:AAA family ATPase [Acidimicrobiales bacterium]
MTAVVAFFNNKGGVGKTTLVYHMAWMMAELGISVLTVDLDPQANLTSVLLDEERVEGLWGDDERRSVYGSLAPLLEGEGGVVAPHVEEISPNLRLVPGDLLLSGAEQELSAMWPNAGDGQLRAFRVESAFAQVIRLAAESTGARLVLVDVGPNLGAINRSAMVASDRVVVPLAPDLYSLQGLRNLGPTLVRWRGEWGERKRKYPRPGEWLPDGAMQPMGYVVLQHSVRMDRAVGAYDRWMRRVPSEYRTSVLQQDAAEAPAAAADPECLGLVKHYHSLIPMAQEARKPVFLLRSADGAIGAHQQAVQAAYGHFRDLAVRILERVGSGELAQGAPSAVQVQ